MIYQNPCPGIFLSRPNRFIAMVDVAGRAERCHVKNTGRCAELLLPGARLILDKAAAPNRATAYDVVAVYKGHRLINMDSMAPNKAFGEFLRAGAYLDGLTHVRAEARFGASRFDFYAETATKKIFIEVKGVTLEEEGTALFPDAPTERGVKHLRELGEAAGAGYEAHGVFVIQMEGCRRFQPNRKMHPAFADALRKAAEAGVVIRAFDCLVSESGMALHQPAPVELT